MERTFNIIWGIVFLAIAIVALFGAIFKNELHQYGLAVIMGGMAWVGFYEAKKTKHKQHGSRNNL